MAKREPGARPKRASAKGKAPKVSRSALQAAAKAKGAGGKGKKADDDKPVGIVAGSLSNRLPTQADEEAFKVWAGKIQKQAKVVKAAEAIVKSEKQALGQIYTDARDAGIPSERIRVLKKTIKENNQTAMERIAERREQAWQERALDTPAYQLGLFDAMLKPPTLKEFEMMGEHAGLNGEPNDNAPGKPGSPEQAAWLSGHKKGQREHAQKVFGDGKKTPDKPADGASNVVAISG